MMLRILFISFIYLSCTSRLINAKSGVVDVSYQLYDTVGNQFKKSVHSFNQKVWFQDSLAIEEVGMYLSVTDTAGVTTQKTVTLFYRFNDLRTKSIYVYGSLSDTAEVLRRYKQSDSEHLAGGWQFNFKRDISKSGDLDAIADTIIDNVNYRRFVCKVNKPLPTSYSITYFRCDLINLPISFDKGVSGEVGCPLVKVFSYSTDKKQTPYSTEINLIRPTLNEIEKKVFKVWEKYAFDHPLQ
jgi:hypothetical protein